MDRKGAALKMIDILVYYVVIGIVLCVVVDISEHKTIRSTICENFEKTMQKWGEKGKIHDFSLNENGFSCSIPPFNLEVFAFIIWKKLQLNWGLYRVTMLPAFAIFWPIIIIVAIYAVRKHHKT